MRLYNYYNSKIEPIYFVAFSRSLIFDKTYVNSINLDNLAPDYYRVSFSLTLGAKLMQDLVSTLAIDFIKEKFVVVSAFVGIVEVPVKTYEQKDAKGYVKGQIVTFIVTDYTISVKQTGFYDFDFGDGVTILKPRTFEAEFSLTDDESFKKVIGDADNKNAGDKDKDDGSILGRLMSALEQGRRVLSDPMLKNFFDYLFLTNLEVPENFRVPFWNKFVIKKSGDGFVAVPADFSFNLSDFAVSQVAMWEATEQTQQEQQAQQPSNQNFLNSVSGFLSSVPAAFGKVQNLVTSAFSKPLKKKIEEMLASGDYKILEDNKIHVAAFFNIWREHLNDEKNFVVLLTFLKNFLNLKYDRLSSIFVDSQKDYADTETYAFLPPNYFFKDVGDMPLINIAPQTSAQTKYEKSKVRVSNYLFTFLMWFFYKEKVVDKISKGGVGVRDFMHLHLTYLVSASAALCFFNVMHTPPADAKKSGEPVSSKFGKPFDGKEGNLGMADLNLGVPDIVKEVFSSITRSDYSKDLNMDFILMHNVVLGHFLLLLENLWNFYYSFLKTKFYFGDSLESVKQIVIDPKSDSLVSYLDPQGHSVDSIVKWFIENVKLQEVDRDGKVSVTYNLGGMQMSPVVPKGGEYVSKNIHAVVNKLLTPRKAIGEYFIDSDTHYYVMFVSIVDFDYLYNDKGNASSGGQGDKDASSVFSMFVKTGRLGYNLVVSVVSKTIHNGSDEGDTVVPLASDDFHEGVGVVLVNPPKFAVLEYLDLQNKELAQNVIVVDELSFGTLRPLLYVADAVPTPTQPVQTTNIKDSILKSEYISLKSKNFVDNMLKRIGELRSESVSNLVVKSDKITSVNIRNFWRSFSQSLYDTYEVSITLPFQPHAYFSDKYSILQPYLLIHVYDKITQNRIPFFSRRYYINKISHSLSPSSATTTIGALGLPPIPQDDKQKNNNKK